MNAAKDEATSSGDGSVEASSSKGGKGTKSVIFPGVSLRRCVELAGRLESKWGTARHLRTEAASDLGYKGLSGTASKTMTALTYFGLIESAGRGYVQVTQQASRLLNPADPVERNEALRLSCFRPSLFASIRERFDGVNLPPQDGIANYLRQEGFDKKYVNAAARQYLDAVRYVQETVGAGGVSPKAVQQDADTKPPSPQTDTPPEDDSMQSSLRLVLRGAGGVDISLDVGTGVLEKEMQRTLMSYLKANLALLDASNSDNHTAG